MEKKNGPWTIKKRTQKHKNFCVELTEDEVIRPDGKPGLYSTVRVTPGIAVLPVDDQGYVHLVKEFKYALGKFSIEAVNGGIQGSEDPVATAQRELKEELGIEADEWIKLGRVDSITSIVDCPQYLFVAKGLRFTKASLEGTEVLSPVKIRFDDAVKMVMDNTITAASTCSLILKARIVMGKN